MSFEAINPFTFKVIIDREGLTIATFFTIFCILALLSLVYTLKSSFEFHSFFCSDIFRFLSHLFCIFYRYFLCGYHVVYIKHLTVITIYAKLIKNKLPSHTYKNSPILLPLYTLCNWFCKLHLFILCIY